MEIERKEGGASDHDGVYFRAYEKLVPGAGNRTHTPVKVAADVFNSSPVFDYPPGAARIFQLDWQNGWNFSKPESGKTARPMNPSLD